MPDVENKRDVCICSDGATEPNNALTIGNQIAGYEILEVLGRGGMGLVLKVRNVKSGRVDAMKVVLPTQEGNRDLVLRFRREIEIQSTLHHPNIAAIHGTVRYGEHTLMLLEYVDGVTLRKRLEDGPIPVAECLEYTLQLLDALSYAHAQGIIHRDINPSNVMIAAKTVKLTDFGIARPSDGPGLTQTGMVVGSLHYLAPEQLNGACSGDFRTDLFAVGVLLHELLTGHLPILKFADKRMTRELESDRALPEELRGIVGKAIADDPARRFQSADAFRRALTAAKRAYCPCDMTWAARHTRRLILRIVPVVAMIFVAALVIACDRIGQKNLISMTRPGWQNAPGQRVQRPVVALPRLFVTAPPDPVRFQLGVEETRRPQANPQQPLRRLVIPKIELHEPAPILRTFDPPVLNEIPVPEALPGIDAPVDPITRPPAPVVLHARHIHNKLRSAEGLLTVYGYEFRFQEFKSQHEFTGSTADLVASCGAGNRSCTLHVMASGHQELIRIHSIAGLSKGAPVVEGGDR